ncbi:MAG: hypothetical protein J5737_07730 [Bacteroidales bacterium]|nr:hypothetical protein [Bacteroidales bacterium]
MHTALEYRLIPERWPEVRRKDWLLPWDGNDTHSRKYTDQFDKILK